MCGWLSPAWCASACFPSSRPEQCGGRWTPTPGPPGLCWSSPGVTERRKHRRGERGSHPHADRQPWRVLNYSVSSYLQVVEALLESADKVGDLVILEGQRVGDLTQRFLHEEERHPFNTTQTQVRFFGSREAKVVQVNKSSCTPACWSATQHSTCSFPPTTIVSSVVEMGLPTVCLDVTHEALVSGLPFRRD